MVTASLRAVLQLLVPVALLAAFELLNAHAGHLDALDDVMEFAATWLIYLIFAAVAALVAGNRWRVAATVQV
ncbi:hypothetical protein [Winogradskya humida]|uniref:Uncharacterized protein n=1 Tax=Winogradskya humida TaxID=113566 RepID=A0ABQ3ZHL9_9ACTN|nr:hypothetical protein [Actinoplanes humidus]GIE18093.1 hypothetical protein Ahu01nite_011950 [Actinoplanes humidus]